jgi:FkbM family methyltransferase
MEVQPTLPIRLIQRLPVARNLAFRAYHRILIYLFPRHRVRTYFGAEFDCHARDLIQGTIIHFRTWEPNTSRTLSKLIHPGDVAVDLGANIGYFTLLFSHLVGDDGSVIAVEASPKIARTLADNVVRNRAGNVRIVNAAVAAKAGTATIYEAPDLNIGATTTRPDRGFPATATVEALSIDQILTADEAKRASLIKVDIEGAEIPVLTHILDSIDRYHERLAIAVEVTADGNPEWRLLFDRFLALGFKAYDLRNEYAAMNLMGQWRQEPRPLREPPVSGQLDVLFTRAEL